MTTPLHRPHTGRRGLLALTLLAPCLLLALLAPPPPSAAAEEKLSRKEVEAGIEALPEKYQQWIESVRILISDQELAAFFKLTEDYHRDAFIAEFWRARDSYPDTARNEYRNRWERRISAVKARFGGLTGDRPEAMLLHGEPVEVLKLDCGILLWPAEIWAFAGSERANFPFFLLFVKRWGAGEYRLWTPGQGLDYLFQEGHGGLGNRNGGSLLGRIADNCYRGDTVAGIIANMLGNSSLAYDTLLAEAMEKPEPPSTEWVAAFGATTTELPPGAETMEATFEVSYPGRRQSRTVVQGLIMVPVDAVELVQLGEHRSYNLLLTGEVVADDTLFDSFRFKFDFLPGEVRDGKLPLAFERSLRPGGYSMVIKLEDLNGGRYFRAQRQLTVPQVEEIPPPADPETARLLAEANELIATGDTTVRIVRPVEELLTGYQRIDTLVTGAERVDQLVFKLDGRTQLIRRRPPHSVEIDFGLVPRPRTLRVEALDAAGSELASDELLLNAGDHRFQVRLVEPSPGRNYSGSLRARVEVEVPEGKALDRLEIFLNETRVATLYQEPFVQPIVLPDDQPIAYVQAVAYLPDGNSTQDLVFINAPDVSDEMNIEYVELYTSVYDRQGRPVAGLDRSAFTVIEDEVVQTVQRFELVKDLPIHATVLLDVSASMEERIVQARDAALTFFEQTITPKDRGAIITFNDQPYLAVKLTADQGRLAAGLAGLKAERGTSLYDSVIFALYYMNGIKGQRALLVLSDGKDESSRFAWEDAQEYARRAGVTIYSIGLDLPRGNARGVLQELSEETGGRSYFIDSAAELPAIYRAIERELRSQYLITYQSTNTSDSNDFRLVEVEVDRSGLEASTIRGYYP